VGTIAALPTARSTAASAVNTKNSTAFLRH
jgi:hypothetical protein